MRKFPTRMVDSESYRIARFLAHCGVASRRKAEDLIRAGEVKVNGEVVQDLGRQIFPNKDAVRFRGRILKLPSRNLTLMLNKPRGILVSRGDPQGRRTVYDLLPEQFMPEKDRLVYIGRLDYMSQGLLLMTTDGKLAHELTHPSMHVEKEYHVRLDRQLKDKELAQIQSGLSLEEERTMPCRISLIGREKCVYSIVLQEGRNRQIRKIMDRLEHQIYRLVRVRVGKLELGGLAAGKFRRVSPDLIRDKLKRFAENQ